MAVEISVIIPAYNEERHLPRLLSDITEARRRYRRGQDAVQVIVADNGSTDGTASAVDQEVPLVELSVAQQGDGEASDGSFFRGAVSPSL